MNSFESEVLIMKEYYLTVYSPSGEHLVNESFTASSDEEAKKIATKKLSEQNYLEQTHRLTRSGKLLMYQR